MSSTLCVLKHVCDIIETELGLAEGQVYLYNQKVNVPPSSGLWVVVGLVSSKAYASKSLMDPAGNQIQSIHMQSLVSIDAMSQDTSALEQKDSILLALTGDYSENLQVAQGFSIARLPTSIVNLSEVEGAAIPYRFNISTQILHVVTKQKAAPYYSTFPTSTIITEP